MRYYRLQLYRYRAEHFFVLKMRFSARYRCVQVIYVCGVYAQKYGIGLKLQACVATVLTVETGKTNDRATGIGGADTDTHQYWRVSADTRYWYRSNPTHQDASDLELCC